MPRCNRRPPLDQYFWTRIHQNTVDRRTLYGKTMLEVHPRCAPSVPPGFSLRGLACRRYQGRRRNLVRLYVVCRGHESSGNTAWLPLGSPVGLRSLVPPTFVRIHPMSRRALPSHRTPHVGDRLAAAQAKALAAFLSGCRPLLRRGARVACIGPTGVVVLADQCGRLYAWDPATKRCRRLRERRHAQRPFYPRVWPPGGGRWEYVHHLVMSAFHGPRPSRKHQISHLDGDAGNNAPRNLAFVLPKAHVRRDRLLRPHALPRPISPRERQQLQAWREEGRSIARMARHLGRGHKFVRRALASRHNGDPAPTSKPSGAGAHAA